MCESAPNKNTGTEFSWNEMLVVTTDNSLLNLTCYLLHMLEGSETVDRGIFEGNLD